MLSESSQQLLTAFLDGALAGQERETLEVLLRDSSEARAWLQKLRENASRLKKLPKVSLGRGFSAKIVAQLPAISVPKPKIVKPSAPVLVQAPKVVRRGLPSWAVGLIAASVVVGMIGGALWYVRDEFNRNLLPSSPVGPPMVKSRRPEVKATAPVSKPVDNQLVQGDLTKDAPPPIVVPPPQPIRFAFADLQGQNAYDSLKWELAHQESARIDIDLKYNARSLSRLIESFHKQGIALAVTTAAESSMGKNQPMLVYAENVRPDALAKVLRELSEIDVQGQSKAASAYEVLRLSPASGDDVKKTTEVLGASLPIVAPAKTNNPGATGVVLPVRGVQTGSREVREFLANRRPSQPGTIRIYVQLSPK